MTKAEKLAAYEMVLDGETYEEIALKFGVSHQYIQQLITNPKKHRKGSLKCKYPGLSAWLQHNNLGASALQGCLNQKYLSPIYARLSGKREITVTEAKAILAYTGLTFEEAFGQEENP